MLVQDLLGVRGDELKAEHDYRLSILKGLTEAMYVNDYGLRMVVASNGAKPPQNWIHAEIFKPKKVAGIDHKMMMAAFGKKKSPA